MDASFINGINTAKKSKAVKTVSGNLGILGNIAKGRGPAA